MTVSINQVTRTELLRFLVKVVDADNAERRLLGLYNV